MAIRPMFCPNLPTTANFPGVSKIDIEFKWVPGQAYSQRQKCAASLRDAIAQAYPRIHVLEISSKSDVKLGIALSALNLAGRDGVTVETAYQCSKVFDGGIGPFDEYREYDSRDARKAVREAAEGHFLVGFSEAGLPWPLEPTSLFYDWLYCSALYQNPELSAQLLQYNGFTDIEFNPEKSVSSQAAAAAYYVSLHAFGQLDAVMSAADDFQRMYTRQSVSVKQPFAQGEFGF